MSYSPQANFQIDACEFFFQHALWPLAVGDFGNAFAQHLAQEQDGAVAVARMFEGSIDDRSLAFHHGLVFQRNVAADLAVEPAVIGFALPLPGFFDVAAVITFLLGRFGIDGEAHLLTVGIIDGQNPDRLLDRHIEAVSFSRPRVHATCG